MVLTTIYLGEAIISLTESETLKQAALKLAMDIKKAKDYARENSHRLTMQSTTAGREQRNNYEVFDGDQLVFSTELPPEVYCYGHMNLNPEGTPQSATSFLLLLGGHRVKVDVDATGAISIPE